MIPEQTLLNYPLFGDNATKVEPDNNKKSNGWQQSDVLPAEHMNWAWYHNSKGISDLNAGVKSMEKELINVLNEAGITPSDSATNQLYKAVRKNCGCIITDAITPAVITNAPSIEAGNIIKIMFGGDVNGSNLTDGLVISYNGSSKAVKVNKNGTLVELKAREVSTNSYKYIQAHTTIEFVYDGVDFIIIGNPEILNGNNYTVYADGKLGADLSHPVGSNYIQFAGQDDPNTLFKFTTWTDVSSTYNGQFFRANGGDSAAFGTAQQEGLPNISGELRVFAGAQAGYYTPLNITNQNGALYADGWDNVAQLNGYSTPAKGNTYIKIDASRSSQIYGSSLHVTPYNSSIKIWKRTA